MTGWLSVIEKTSDAISKALPGLVAAHANIRKAKGRGGTTLSTSRLKIVIETGSIKAPVAAFVGACKRIRLSLRIPCTRPPHCLAGLPTAFAAPTCRTLPVSPLSCDPHVPGITPGYAQRDLARLVVAFAPPVTSLASQRACTSTPHVRVSPRRSRRARIVQARFPRVERRKPRVPIGVDCSHSGPVFGGPYWQALINSRLS